MALVLLIARTDFPELKQVSASMTDAKINEFIQEAQFADLRKIVGDMFYRDLLDNKATVSYAPLFNGADFDIGGITKHHFGIKTVLVHFTYARLIMRGDVVSMPLGFVRKKNPDGTSETLSSVERRDIRDENIRLANDHFALVREYLDINPALFPKWISSIVPFFGGGNNALKQTKYDNI